LPQRGQEHDGGFNADIELAIRVGGRENERAMPRKALSFSMLARRPILQRRCPPEQQLGRGLPRLHPL